MHIFTLHRVLKEPRSLATLRARASTRGVYCCVGFSEQERLRREEGQRPLQAEEILAPHPPWNTHTDRQTDRWDISQLLAPLTFTPNSLKASLFAGVARYSPPLTPRYRWLTFWLEDKLRQAAGFSSSFSLSVRHCRGVSGWTRLFFFSSRRFKAFRAQWNGILSDFTFVYDTRIVVVI